MNWPCAFSSEVQSRPLQESWRTAMDPYSAVCSSLSLRFFPRVLLCSRSTCKRRKEEREYQAPLGGEKLLLWTPAAQPSEALVLSVSRLLRGRCCPFQTALSRFSRPLWYGPRKAR